MHTKATNKIIREYDNAYMVYEDYAEVIASLLKTFLAAASIPFYTIDHRGKSVESLREKIQRKRAEGKKYNKLQDITDLAGVRIILFFSDDVERVRYIVLKEFKNIFTHNKYEAIAQKRKQDVGYTALHELIKLTPRRARLNEYRRYKSMICEIQIKSILQHAWSEIEHDIGYKPQIKEVDLERSKIRSLLKKNALLLQNVDNNFVEIRKKHIALLTEYQLQIDRRKLKQLPINFDTVLAYLQKNIGARKISHNIILESLETARLQGFQNLLELDDYFEKTNYTFEM